MCGIFGVIADRDAPYSHKFLRRSLTTLARKSQSRGKDSSGLVFYDAAAKQIRLTWANSNGAMSLAVAFKKNGKWVEKGSGSLADGRKTEFTSTMNIEADGKTHTWTGGGTVGGERTDDQCDIWRRVDE